MQQSCHKVCEHCGERLVAATRETLFRIYGQHLKKEHYPEWGRTHGR
jgi:hypothetical protein